MLEKPGDERRLGIHSAQGRTTGVLASALAGLTGSPRQTIEDEPEYEELRATIAKMREQHLKALRRRIYYRPDNPGVRARLYLAGFKSSDRYG